MIKKCLLAALVALSMPVASLAATINGEVAANRSTRVHAFTIADPSTCTSPGKPKMSVSREPQNGSVSFEWGYVPSTDRFRNCAGGRMRAMFVVYTPNKGYRGSETFAVRYSFPSIGGYGYSGRTGFSFDLRVK